jgi:hypothetical protein
LDLLENQRLCIFTNPNSNSCYLKIVLHPKSYIYAIQYTIIADGDDALIKNDFLCGSCMPKVIGDHKCPFVIRTFVRASPAVLTKYFSHPSLVIYSFATPPHTYELQLRPKIGEVGTTNSKPPGRIIMMGE